MRRPTLAVAMATVLTSASPVFLRGQDVRLTEALPALMDSAGIPGLSIAVIQNGTTTWAGAFGHQNDPDRTPVNQNTIFPAASLSKPVFAYAVMRLAERGEFDIDKPLADYLPYERLEHDDRYKSITARHVMMHGTGLRNWQAGRLELMFAPGHGFNYSGEGFVYLQRTVEHVTGKSLEQLARHEVFEPLGMTRTSYVWREAFAGNAVTGSTESDLPQPLPHRTEGNAAHSLLTTATDYARFVRAVMSRNGLRDSTVEDVLTPHNSARRAVNSTAADPYVSWGLGWGIQEGPAGRAFFHWGDNGAWRCYVVAYPETQTGLVYFTNSSHGLSIARAVASRVVDDAHWAVDWLRYEAYDNPARLARRRIQSAFIESVELGVGETRRLRRQRPDLANLELLAAVTDYLADRQAPVAATAAANLGVTLFPDAAAAHERYGLALLQAGDYEGAITAYRRVRGLQPDDPATERRIHWIEARMSVIDEPIDVPRSTLERYAGAYGPRRVTIHEHRLVYQREGNAAYPLIPLEDGTFALDGLPTFRLRFVADDGRPAHKVIGLYFDGNSDESVRTP